MRPAQPTPPPDPLPQGEGGKKRDPLPQGEGGKGRFSGLISLVGGSATAQAITLASLVVLTRLYAAEAYGEYAASLAFVAMLGPLLALRYETAILMPQRPAQARLLLGLSLLLALVFGLLGAAAALTSLAFHQVRAATVLWVSAGALLLLYELVALAWLNRQGRYRAIGLMAVTKATAIAGFQIACHREAYGLFIGFLAGSAVLALVLSAMLAADLRATLAAFSLRRGRALLRRYRDFPKFSLPAAALNLVGTNIPVVLIRVLLGEAYAGYFAMVNRLLMAGATLFGGNINRIYNKKVRDAINSGKAVLPLTRRYFALGAAIALAVFVGGALFYALNGFVLLFGADWVAANDYVLALLAVASISIAATSVAHFAYLGRNDIGLYYQAAYLIASAVSIYAGYRLLGDPVYVVAVYSGTICLVLSAQVFTVMRTAGAIDLKLADER